jgi:ribonuclease E
LVNTGEVDAVVEPEVVAVIEVSPAPSAVAPTPEPVLAAAVPDPAEISEPPAAPRRGWWRRGS